MKRILLALALLLAAALPAPALAQGPALTIEQRLDRAESEIAIRRLLIDYSWALDTRDTEAYVALFAREGEWVNGDIVRKGPDEIRALLAGIFRDAKPGAVSLQSTHNTTNIAIDVDGDRATARSRYLVLRRGADGSPVPMLAGRYTDTLIREDGKWKILRRIDDPIMPTREEWAEIMRARAAKP